MASHAIENWDDDDAFDFSSKSQEGGDLRHSLNTDLSAGFSDTHGDSDSEGTTTLYKIAIRKGYQQAMCY